ncbi:hypothetical protein [Segatella sp.]|uniref:hypothetical protein n=1 Tax=Segatella sp. TaxID=2974253 RepID=UPI00307FDB7C
MNPIAIRLLSQQLICPQFDTPQKVVSHFGAIQAQDYRMVRWAVMMRTRKPSSFAFKNAYDEGEIVRSAYTNNGIFFSVIAHDGRICGNWIPWEKNLNISYFDSAEKDLSFEKQWKIFNGTIKKK